MVQVSFLRVLAGLVEVEIGDKQHRYIPVEAEVEVGRIPLLQIHLRRVHEIYMVDFGSERRVADIPGLGLELEPGVEGIHLEGIDMVIVRRCNVEDEKGKVGVEFEVAVGVEVVGYGYG
jgi:hypothetical protein